MSSFIVPMGSLPTISSIEQTQGFQGLAETGAQGKVPFSNFLQSALSDLASTSEVSNLETLNMAVGTSDDLHTAGIASVQANTAISFTSSLVSSAIRSYNEIIRMQI